RFLQGKLRVVLPDSGLYGEAIVDDVLYVGGAPGGGARGPGDAGLEAAGLPLDRDGEVLARRRRLRLDGHGTGIRRRLGRWQGASAHPKDERDRPGRECTTAHDA